MNRDLYKQSFTLDNSPDYHCPKCNIGLLRIKKDHFEKYTTIDVTEATRHPEFEPEWIEYIFNCVFECNNDKCDGKVLCTGRGGVGFDIEVDDYGQQYQEFDDYYQPLFFHPNLKLITIPKDTPTNIEKILNQSFELFFTSPSAAANLVRISIEEILTNQGVESTRNLHRRIEKLPEKYQAVKDHLFALKWLGNAGSHSDEELSLDDTMDAYELVEYVLSKMYYSNPTDIDRLAKEINDFEGPKKRAFFKL